jgi:hypothetical protein
MSNKNPKNQFQAGNKYGTLSHWKSKKVDDSEVLELSNFIKKAILAYAKDKVATAELDKLTSTATGMTEFMKLVIRLLPVEPAIPPVSDLTIVVESPGNHTVETSKDIDIDISEANQPEEAEA